MTISIYVTVSNWDHRLFRTWELKCVCLIIRKWCSEWTLPQCYTLNLTVFWSSRQCYFWEELRITKQILDKNCFSFCGRLTNFYACLIPVSWKMSFFSQHRIKKSREPWVCIFSTFRYQSYVNGFGWWFALGWITPWEPGIRPYLV